jgi:hypothetical protein
MANAPVKPVLVEEITVPLSATSPSQTIFIADDSYQVVGVQAVADVLGGAGATVTVEVLTGVQAPGGGVAQLTAALALNGVAHQVVTGTMIAAPTTAVAGNRIGIVMAGTLTGLVGYVTIAIQRVWTGAENGFFVVKGSLPNGDDPIPVPTYMAFGVAQSAAISWAQKYRGNAATVRDANGNIVYTSPIIPAPAPGAIGGAAYG